MHEVLNNLITNASKYTPEGGAAKVTFARSGETYRTQIADNSASIPKAAQVNIFTKVYQAQAGLNSGNTGVGLVIFISKSIIDRHNGHISFTSEEGKSSIFTFEPRVFDGANLYDDSKSNIMNIRKRNRGWITKNIAR